MITYKFPKYQWALTITDTAKRHVAPNFINLVQTAYAKTPEGSFVNTVKDVLSSSWKAYDWDKDPEADVVIFFRTARAGESWSGYKNRMVNYVTDQDFANKLFPGSDVRMLLSDRSKPGRYQRRVGGKVLRETVFGMPKLRNAR